MRKANTVEVDAAITLAASQRDALGVEMAKSPEVAQQCMPKMVALCESISTLKVERSRIIRETFYGS